MLEIPKLDIHITHTCNLTCESCSDFTNHKLSGMLSTENAKKWISYWNTRLKPKQFIILGGEPTLNKDLIEFLYIFREMWPNSEIMLVSNAFFLHLHEDLGKCLSYNNITLSISIHDNSEEYLNKIKPNLKLCKEWIRKYNTKISVAKSYKNWRLIYKGYGPYITPFEDNNPKSSWKNCPTEHKCFQLYQEKIWKCAPITYLPLMAKKYTLSEKWDPYLKYTPLSPNCSDEELVQFFSRQEEPICGMCPAKKIYVENPKSPLLSVEESINYFLKS